MEEIDLEEMYTCSYCPTDRCKYCRHNNWCIFSLERQQVEQNITLLTEELKTYENMIERVKKTGKLWKEVKEDKIKTISFNEMLKRKDAITEDLRKQKEYRELRLNGH